MLAILSISCNPEEEDTVSLEVENTQSQFKPLTIRATISEPIQQVTSGTALNLMRLVCLLGDRTLSSSVPNNIGQNTIEFNGTAVSNTNLNCILYYQDFEYDMMTNPATLIHNCDSVMVEIIYDGVVVFEESKEMGGTGNGSSCGDGINWSFNYTLQ
jgi:hypothetical protein